MEHPHKHRENICIHSYYCCKYHCFKFQGY